MRCARVFLVAAVAAPLLLTSCSSGGSSTTKLKVAAQEFKLSPSPETIKAGKVNLTVINSGTEKHEAVVVKSIGPFPLKADGSIDEDKIPADEKYGEVDDVAGGTTKSGDLDRPLTAGIYTIFCNVVTDNPSIGSHFKRGMKARLVVR